MYTYKIVKIKKKKKFKNLSKRHSSSFLLLDLEAFQQFVPV